MKRTILAIILIIASSVSALELPSDALGVGAGGQVHAVCIDPDDPNIFYIGTDVAGVWRSDDSGQHWEQWSKGLTNSNECKSCYVDDIKVVDDTVYAATLGGIYSRQRTTGDWILETPPETHSYIFDNAGDVRKYGTAIPFSTIAHDTLTGKLFAGAGTARSRTKWAIYPNTVCAEYDTDDDFNFVQYENGPSDLYSLWENVEGEWMFDDDSAGMGMVRALDAKGGKVLLTGTNGIHLRKTDGEWIRLDTMYYIGSNPTEWGKWCWSARFADANTIYALADAHSDTSFIHGVYKLDLSAKPPEWKQVGSLGSIGKPTVVNGPDYTWEQVLDRGYVNRMTLNTFDDLGAVELYIGERQRYNEGGLYYLKVPHDEEDLNSLEWTHMICQRGQWGNAGINKFHYWDFIQNEFEILTDKGWQDNDIIVSNCEVAISTTDESVKILAWQYSNGWLYEKSDTEVTVNNIYCEEGSSGTWNTRGDNMLVCHDICSLADGTLLVADDDYGVYRRKDVDTGFQWLNWDHQEGVKRDAFRIESVDEQIFGIHHALDERYDDSTKSNDGQRRVMSYFDEGGEGVEDDVWLVLCDLDSLHVVDFVFIGSGEILLAARNKIYGPPQESYLVHLQPDSSGGYTEVISGVIDSKLYELEAIPGTSLVALALSGYGGRGIAVVDLDKPGLVLEYWLHGNDGTFLNRCAKEVRTLKTDVSGSVLYVGTNGQSHSVHSTTPGVGTVLRLLAPFSTEIPDPDQWEVLANNDGIDSFDLESIPNVYHGDWTSAEQAYRMTKITSLAIDPNDPAIVYAGMSSSRFHTRNGVWRYELGEWEQILGQGESFHATVGALEFDASDPSILYAGSNGEDVWEINVPVSLPILAKFTDRSEEVYQPTQPDNIGVKYTGHPYSEVMFDFDLDNDMDLLVTQTDGEVVLYEHVGYLDGNDPDYHKIIIEDLVGLVGFRGIAVADFTNDTEPSRLGRGYPDIFLAHETDAMILQYINGVYVDVSDNLGVRDLIQNSWCASWGDYNGDGQVDLFVGKGTGSNNDPFASSTDIGEIANVVLRNDFQSSGTFIDVSSSILSSESDSLTATVTASWIDIDNDNDMDLFVGDVGNSEPVQNNSSLYINQGDGKFIEDGNFSSTIDIIEQVRGSVWVDYQNDNDWDLVIPSSDNQYFLINDGSGYLGLQLHSNLPGSYSTVLVQDFDLDNQTDYLWLPYGQDQLAALAWGQPGISVMELLDSISWSGIETTGPIFTAALADLTGDGDLDLFIGDVTKEDENSYGKFYYRSGNVFGTDFPVNDWFSVRLIGDGGTNKSAIGAIVEAEIDGIDYWQVVDGGSGFGTQRSSLLTFGVPPGHSENLQCTVLWPDGYSQNFVATKDKTTFVYDDSPPELVTGSFSAIAYVLPENESDWVFQWDTQYSSDPVLDTVVITEVPGATPNCQIDTIIITPASSNVSSKITRQPDGSYRHIMTLHNTDCASRCSYNAQASSSVYNQDGTLRTTSTATRPFRMAACLGM